MASEIRYRQHMLNPIWRLNNLYMIVDKDSRLIKFQQNSVQEKINTCTDKRRIILKARQFGVTTNCVLALFDNTIFNRNVTNVILAHEHDAIKKIFRIVKRAYKYLHPDLKPKLDRGGGSRYEMFFPDINSLIYCDLESRGDTIANLHVSEAAFMQEERFISTLQAVPLGGRVTLESTPNGMDNFFYDLWQEPDSGYKNLFYPWYFHSEYKVKGSHLTDLTKEEKDFVLNVKNLHGLNITHDQLRFRRLKQKELKAKFIQEYPEDDITCFIMSGASVCDQQKIKRLIQNVNQPLHQNEQWKIFKNPDSKMNYVVGADPAQGIGGDYSVASIMCVQTMEEVAFLRGQFPPFQFARKLEEICQKFSTGGKMPLLAIESNNHGHAVLLEMREHLHYPNLFFAKKDRPGWITDSISRPIMLNQMVDAIENDHVKINSLDTLREMITLVNMNGKVQAAGGKHDDSIMATAIAIQMLLKNAREIRRYENIGKAIIV